MNQKLNLIQEKITHVIITYSKGIYKITARQNTHLQTLVLDSEIIINDNTVKLRAISEIQTIEKYYETHPEKRPQRNPIEFKNLPEYKSLMNPEFYTSKRKNALMGLIKGLKKYIASPQYKGTDTPKQLLKTMELRLSEI